MDWKPFGGGTFDGLVFMSFSEIQKRPAATSTAATIPIRAVGRDGTSARIPSLQLF